MQSAKPFAANLVISDSPIYDYGLKPLSSLTTRVFTVTNSGTGPATQMSGSFYLSTAFAFFGGTFPGDTGTCSDVLGAGMSCTVVVAFTPEYSGSFEEVLRVTYHNGAAYKQTSAPTLRGAGS